MTHDDEPRLSEAELEAERHRLRDVLAFPAAVEGTAMRERSVERPESPTEEAAPEHVASPVSGEVARLTARVDELSGRVATLTGVIEALLDMPPVAPTPTPFTADEFTDVATQMVHLVDVRLDAHREQIEQLLAARPTEAETEQQRQADPLTAEQFADVAARLVRMIEERFAEQSARAEQLIADLATRGKAIEAIEENQNFARLDDRLGLISRAVHEAQTNVQELRDTIVRAAAASEDESAGRLDIALLQALDGRLEEVATQLIDKMDGTLAARMQRFEALNQAMITLVGDPVDTLTTKLQQLASEREAMIDAVETLQAMAETQQRILRTLSTPSSDDDAG